MKFEIGDKVVVKHSNEEGTVIDAINDKMVMVEVRGVKFPVYNDQLEYPYFKRFSEQETLPGKESTKDLYIDQVPREKVTSKKQTYGWCMAYMFIPKFGSDEFGDEVVEVLESLPYQRNSACL